MQSIPKKPVVTFVVPCFKLAHLLGECIQSILAQTYRDFEILVMDDCSPDNTSEVAQSFGDDRIIYVRNEKNLRHLQNYNKGISMARGRYVWLISADDLLTTPYVLQKYVDILDSSSSIGFAFCPGRSSTNNPDSNFSKWMVRSKKIHGSKDKIYHGHDLLRKLLVGNSIVAASGLVRKACYDKVGLFPLDMPWAGDWYLWCVFAMFYDAAYFAEAMVCYREHDLCMTNQLMSKSVLECVNEDISVVCAVKKKASEFGYFRIAESCINNIAMIYANSMLMKRYPACDKSMTAAEFEQSVSKQILSAGERQLIRSLVYMKLGDHSFTMGKVAESRDLYRNAFSAWPWRLELLAKLTLAESGFPGFMLRRWAGSLRR